MAGTLRELDWICQTGASLVFGGESEMESQSKEPAGTAGEPLQCRKDKGGQMKPVYAAGRFTQQEYSAFYSAAVVHG